MYLFLIRDYPDIDHITPIIYKIACSDPSQIVILCQNLNYDIRSDFLLNFLKRRFNIETRSIYDLYVGNFFKSLLSRCFLFTRRIVPRKYRDQFFNKFKGRIYDVKWAQNLLESLGVRLLAIDYQSSVNFCIDSVTQAAKQAHIPIVKLPHGNSMDDISIKRPAKKRKPTAADYVVVQHEKLAQVYRKRQGVDGEVITLGCARYCDEWEREYNGLLRASFTDIGLPNEENKLKVLAFGDPKTKFSRDSDAALAIEGLEYTDLVLKSKNRIKHQGQSLVEYPSSRLVQWADVVVMPLSGIALEVLWQQKTLIYLKYLAPDVYCRFEDYGACWAVNSQQELTEALEAIHRDPSCRPYTQESVNQFIDDVVYDGNRSRDVLSDYENFLTGLVCYKERVA